MSRTPCVFTYNDLIAHLASFCDGLSREEDQTRARGAIQSAYRSIGMARKWRYLQTHGRIDLVAPYTTGTITTSGSTVTLASGTWPSWARYGKLAISGKVPIFKIAERTSGSILTLDPSTVPASDISTATSFTLFRSEYTLPADLWAMNEINDECNFWSPCYASPNTVMGLERAYKGSYTPFQWTVTGSSDLLGQHSLWVYGYSATATTLDFVYTRTPRRMVFDGVNYYSSTTTCTGPTAGATTCTITGTNLKDQVVGSIIRFSRNTALPRGDNSTSPYLFQNVITAVADAGANTTVTLDSAAPYTVTSTAYTLSDPVDIGEYMLEALLRSCEYYMLLKTDPAKAALWDKLVQNDLVLSRERDSMVSPPDRVEGWRAWRPRDWPYLVGTVNRSTA